MSDNSYEQEDWGSQGSDNDWGQPGGKDDDEVDTDTEIENNFYEADGEMKDNPKDALEKLESGVVMMEENREEKKFCFRAIMNIVIITA